LTFLAVLKAGQTLLLPKPGHDISHLWVVILGPDPETHETVIVNLTTLRDHSDKTVVLSAGEHPFITHATAVNYSDARIVDARKIEAALKVGSFPSHRECSAALLVKIQEGLFASPLTPKKVKDYTGQRLSVP
jgi:hypothetical protein